MASQPSKTSEFFNTVIGLGVIVGVIALIVSMCSGDEEQETAKPKVPKVDPKVYELSRWEGVVAPYEPEYSALLIVDLPAYDVRGQGVPLSFTDPISMCPQRSTDIQPSKAAYATALKRLAPPGTRVVVERLGELAEFGAEQFVYLVDPAGAVDPVSLNEQLVLAGAAGIGPTFLFEEGLPLGSVLDGTIAELTTTLPYGVQPAAREEWARMLQAFRHAWVNQIGEIGVCAKQLPEEAAAREETERQDEERQRIREFGPDGVPDSGDENDGSQSQHSPSSGDGGGSSSGSGGSSDSGYTGSRCYSPGGKTWRPC